MALRITYFTILCCVYISKQNKPFQGYGDGGAVPARVWTPQEVTMTQDAWAHGLLIFIVVEVFLLAYLPWCAMLVLLQIRVAKVWPVTGLLLSSFFCIFTIAAANTGRVVYCVFLLWLFGFVVGVMLFCRFHAELSDRVLVLKLWRSQRRTVALHEQLMLLAPRVPNVGGAGHSLLETVLSRLKQAKSHLRNAASVDNDDRCPAVEMAIETLSEAIAAMADPDLGRVPLVGLPSEHNDVIEHYMDGSFRPSIRVQQSAPIGRSNSRAQSRSHSRILSVDQDRRFSVLSADEARSAVTESDVSETTSERSRNVSNSDRPALSRRLTTRSRETKRARLQVMTARRAASLSGQKGFADTLYADLKKSMGSSVVSSGSSTPGSSEGRGHWSDDYDAGRLLVGGRSWAEIEDRVGFEWSFDIFSFASEQPDVLVHFGAVILVPYCKVLEINFSGLVAFLGALQNCYWDNAYHNKIHAAFVAHATCCLASMLNLSCSETFSEITEVVYVTASLGHDVGHPSRNNQFFVNTYDPLARIYNDAAVLENYHAFLLFHVIDNGPCDIFANLLVPTYREVRRRIIDIILATDMKEHFESISKFRVRRSAQGFNYATEIEDMWLVIKILVKAADLSHASVEWEQHFLWSCLIQEEFYQQGEEEKSLGHVVSPLCDRDLHAAFAKSQMGFLEFVVAPLFIEIREVDATGRTSRCLDNLWVNKERWVGVEAAGVLVDWPPFVLTYKRNRLAQLRRSCGLKAAEIRIRKTAQARGKKKAIPKSRMLRSQEAPEVLAPEHPAATGVGVGAQGTRQTPRASSDFRTPRRRGERAENNAVGANSCEPGNANAIPYAGANANANCEDMKPQRNRSEQKNGSSLATRNRNVTWDLA